MPMVSSNVPAPPSRHPSGARSFSAGGVALGWFCFALTTSGAIEADVVSHKSSLPRSAGTIYRPRRGRISKPGSRKRTPGKTRLPGLPQPWKGCITGIFSMRPVHFRVEQKETMPLTAARFATSPDISDTFGVENHRRTPNLAPLIRWRATGDHSFEKSRSAA